MISASRTARRGRRDHILFSRTGRWIVLRRPHPTSTCGCSCVDDKAVQSDCRPTQASSTSSSKCGRHTDLHAAAKVRRVAGRQNDHRILIIFWNDIIRAVAASVVCISCLIFIISPRDGVAELNQQSRSPLARLSHCVPACMDAAVQCGGGFSSYSMQPLLLATVCSAVLFFFSCTMRYTGIAFKKNYRKCDGTGFGENTIICSLL
jgi:hypothetical protein